MTASEISGNNAAYGGGVWVGSKVVKDPLPSSSFTMVSGTISSNYDSADDWVECGGGVCVSLGGAFTMANGEISGNTASKDTRLSQPTP